MNYWLSRGTVTGRILRWPPRLELPGVHPLYNVLLLGVGGTWDNDEKAFSWLRYVRWKRWRDSADVIKVPASWALINQKVIILGSLGQIIWILKRGSRAQRFSLLLSLKNETAVTSTTSGKSILLTNTWNWKMKPQPQLSPLLLLHEILCKGSS